MNYKRIYDDLISDRLNNQNFEGYCEKHHIVPKSLGGTDDNSNMIILSASDHLFAHALLARVYKGKMIFALHIMLGINKSLNRKLRLHYEYVKSNYIFSKSHRNKISESNTGKTHSNKTRKIMSKLATGRSCKPVSQYDKSGKFIRKHKSMISASDKLSVAVASICKCVNYPDKFKTAGGFKWELA